MAPLIENPFFTEEKRPLHIRSQNKAISEQKLYDDLLNIFEYPLPYEQAQKILKSINLKPDGEEDIRKEILYAMLQTTDNAVKERFINTEEALKIKAILIKKLPALIFYQAWK